MAKPAKFMVGTSGSGKHTETYSDGAGLSADRTAESGPRVGPGAMKSRVESTFGGGSKNGETKPGKMGKYSAG